MYLAGLATHIMRWVGIEGIATMCMCTVYRGMSPKSFVIGAISICLFRGAI